MRNKILDDFYYKAKIILNDSHFKKSVDFLLNEFKKFNIPIPTDGFKSNEEYENWRKKYWNKFDEISKNKIYNQKLKEIIKDNKKINSKEKNSVNKLRKRLFPPVFKSFIKEIVEHYNIDKKYKKKFEEFVFNYIFFKKDDFPHTNFSVKLEKNKKTKETELYVRIFGYTKKEDIIKNWSIIEKEKKILKDYHGKSKGKENFKRDLEIYKLYRKLKENWKTRRKKDDTAYPNKRIDHEIWVAVNKKYGDLSWENIRKIIDKMNKIDKKFVTDK